ncbi:MAG: hypothetical protein PHV51_05165 [Methanosarcinaceae archaeon]|nr:hypothetical protein [Methanosarcinaceae archaeon]MDD4497527.1 hypothetical protein [Methanosarcinaceae archaeon]
MSEASETDPVLPKRNSGSGTREVQLGKCNSDVKKGQRIGRKRPILDGT